MQADTAQGTQPAWDAKQYSGALAHLERLQEQIDDMRRTIPSIVGPMAKPAKDKAQLFVQIKSAAVRSVDDVQALRNNWSSEQTQSILNRSQQSLEKDSDLSKAGTVPRYGWTQDTEMG
ncbi:hypothetical protein CB0940_06339 [Cercospora beticola]|nr:hypothetical protein CB0940_06339 [Cercospora beticola]PIA97105.1 hypothetical protein CB0940_06339 [Cercospora beticola]